MRKGKVKMTKPTIICFIGQNGNDQPKIFIRTLLYSTSERGQYIQNMFVRLIHNEITQDFNVWAYGDNGLVRGSGLFVDKKGISIYHHFLLPKGSNYVYEKGDYVLQFFVEMTEGASKKIFEERLSLTEQQASALVQNKAVFYDWAPNTQNYFSYVDSQPLKVIN